MEPTRREVCKWGLAGLAAALGSSLACRGAERYNVLSITVDDLNNWTGCLGGHPDARTPNIDALAASGRLFRRAYSPGADCNSARTAVLTGVRPWTSGVYTNRNPFPAERINHAWPAVFSGQGYRVVAAGKVFHIPEPTAWDEYYLPEAPDLIPHLVAPEEYGFPGRDKFNWGPVKFRASKTWDGKLAQWAARRLGEEHDRPFLMCVGFSQPHMPWWVPQRYYRPFEPSRVTLPEYYRNDLKDVPRFARLRAHRGDFLRVVREGQWPQAVASYLAAMYFVDDMIGRVLDALEKGPNADRTIVTLWSDHGFALGQKQDWRKSLLWEHIVQVPFVIRVPRMAQSGTACHRAVDLLHLYPTLADLCGLAGPEELEGRSLRPLLERPDADWELPALSTAGWGAHAVRTQRWRYIRYGDASEELYDHDADPLEWSNLAGQPEHTALKQDLARWLPEQSGTGSA